MAELKIVIGEEYKIKKEKGNQFNNSLFKDVFQNAARNINVIIKQARENNIINDNDNITNDDYNNIVIFTGDRGTGKSSTMVSFAEALLNKNNSDIKKVSEVGNFFKDKNYNELINTDFLSIDMIDPSLFASKDTILEIIISKMFLKFQKSLEGQNVELDYDKKRKLITSFQCVFENLKTLHNDKKVIYELDVIEALSRLAYGTNLKEKFYDLVNEYLSYFNIKNGFLLIAIDDFDLNINGAFEMLEDIRKFLIQKNIIILLSGKIEQLNDSVKQKIIIEYESLINYERKINSDISFLESPQTKANKFIEKLFPPDHLNSLSSVLIDNEVDFFIIKNEEVKIQTSNIQDGVYKFIYDKGFFLHKPNNGFSYFMPRTLRDITNLVSFIDGMKKNDLLRFKNYLDNIKNDFLESNEILTYEELEYNSYVLNKFYVNWISPKLSRRTPLGFSNPGNFRNSSFADIVSIYIHLSRSAKSIDFNFKKFIIYSSTLYSITLKQLKEKDNNILWQVFAGEIVNDNFELFPKDGKKRRDFFHVRNVDKILKPLKNENKLWISCFFSHIGKIDQIPYRNNEQVYFENTLQDENGNYNYNWATFNCLTFIISLFFPDKFAERLSFKNNDEIDLFIRLNDWKESMWDKYDLFYNLDFIIDLVYELSYFSRNKIKKTLGNYNNTLKIYLIEGLEYSLSNLNKKYNYINLDIEDFMKNPLFIHWEDNSELIEKLLIEVFESQSFDSDYTENDIKIAKYVLNRYGRYFDPEGDFSNRGAKQSMNSVIKYFKESDSIKEQLQEFRDLMDQDPEDGLERIKELLTIVSKNG